MTGGEPFDPGRLVELARAQHPDRPWLADALARCTGGCREGRAYVYFVEPDDPAWVFEENVVLEDRGGDVVVDVLRGRRIGGAEFLRYL